MYHSGHSLGQCIQKSIIAVFLLDRAHHVQTHTNTAHVVFFHLAKWSNCAQNALELSVSKYFLKQKTNDELYHLRVMGPRARYRGAW